MGEKKMHCACALHPRRRTQQQHQRISGCKSPDANLISVVDYRLRYWAYYYIVSLLFLARFMQCRGGGIRLTLCWWWCWCWWCWWCWSIHSYSLSRWACSVQLGTFPLRGETAGVVLDGDGCSFHGVLNTAEGEMKIWSTEHVFRWVTGSSPDWWTDGWRDAALRGYCGVGHINKAMYSLV